MLTPALRDIVIIGSGPAGCTAAMYAARAGLDVVVLASPQTPGGALASAYQVANYPGATPGVHGADLMAAMREQAQRCGAEFVDHDAVAVDLLDGIKYVTDGADTTHAARAVIIATGTIHLTLGVPGEQRLTGAGVAYSVPRDASPFEGQAVVVVGAGDAACQDALNVARFAEHVDLVHPLPDLTASAAARARVAAQGNVRVVPDVEVVEILGGSAVDGMVLRRLDTGITGGQDVDAVFIAAGRVPLTRLVADQVHRYADGTIAVAAPGTTVIAADDPTRALPGVFAAGDCMDSTYRKAVVAAGCGAKAAMDAECYLAQLDDPHGEADR